MSGPWWGKDVDPSLATQAADDATGAALPPLVTDEPDAIRRELDARRAGYTPAWTSQRDDDPGRALLDVYAEQHAAVARAIDLLPEKARVEHLRAAGVLQRAPRPLEATLTFEVSPAAPGGVLVGQGFAVLGRDIATGTSVQFEIEREIFAVPATLAVLGRRFGGSVSSLTIPKPGTPARVYPFGVAPQPGTAMYLGLDSPVVPVPQLSIGFLVAPRGDAPPPVSEGGLFPMPGTEPPRVSWELFVDGVFVEAEVIRDETASFTQSGIVELRVPDGWRPGVPPGADPAQPLYWIRSQLLDGAWPDAPALSFVGLNMVRAMSGRTVRDEIVDTPITLDPAQRQVLTLADRPVLDGTLRVSIDEGGSELVAWKAVPDLSGVGPDERAFVFDPARGTLTFGSANGTNGRPLPEGFRHVHASYRVAVTATKVAAGAISTLVGSAAFLTSVTNLDPATGGRDTETLEEALVRGPREIRARERAVAVADYEVLALASPGADIRRAHAVGGLHPRFPGRPVPGVVAVFVVGAARDDGQPPIPNDATLHAVSEHLSTCAPRGAEVVAAAPTFHSIRVEASLDIRRDADVTATAHEVSQLLDTWFDPVRGGADGQGWPFGGAVRYDAVVRFLLERLGGRLIAIPDLRFVVDTRRSRPCEDVAIPAHDLLWPAPHELVPVPRRPS